MGIVYHYCNVDVFMKIISGKSIRLSDITKSNDSTEIIWITRFMKGVFLKEFRKEAAKTKYFKEGYKEEIFINLVEKYTDMFFKDGQRQYACFVCCFSKANDLLSQWRGYSDDASGLAIGFDILTHSNDVNAIHFGDIVYGERKQRTKIKKYADSLISKLKLILRDSCTDIEKKSEDAFYESFLQLFKLSILMKNPFFIEEKESRIYYLKKLGSSIETKLDCGDLSKVEYYIRGDDIVPYIELKLDGKNIDIKNVVIGPKCKARKRDVERLLSDNGFKCDVIESKGTYR